MRRAPAAAVAVLCAGGLAGCGGSDAAGQSAAAAEPVGDESAGSVAQFADCVDWRAGSRAERYATIAVLRGQLTPQRSKTAASPLPDERAYEVFDKVCSSGAGERLRLYKLYVRVQGFSPLSG